MTEIETIAMILSGIMGLSSGLVIWLGWAGKHGKLKRNYIAGMRIPSTLENDEAWSKGHTAAATASYIAGWGSLIMTALLLPLHYFGIVPLSEEWLSAAVLIAAGWLLVWVIVGGLRADRAAKRQFKKPEADSVAHKSAEHR